MNIMRFRIVDRDLPMPARPRDRSDSPAMIAATPGLRNARGPILRADPFVNLGIL